ncbi:MAG: hypothetical protein LC798_03005 [Chloroflexi bacterium]|nr:hypothetical protein [Chloroflexota bacterium]
MTEPQRALIVNAAQRCSYDFTRCLPTLRSQWGAQFITVAVSDLTRWSQAQEARAAEEDHVHHHEHLDVTDDESGATGHGIVVRHRVLGLAWSNGKIEVEQTLADQNPELFLEVFLSEVAHEVDWFDPALNQAGEDTLFDVMHGVVDATPGRDTPEHGHDWFDMDSYNTWAGEAWMGLFTAATSDVRVTLTQFVHKVTPEGIDVTRRLLGITPAPEPKRVFAGQTSAVFHDTHGRLRRDRWFDSAEEAVATGLRPCRVCKP